jgi:hypothetical protein
MLGALPAHLFRQAKLVEYDLALRHSSTGLFRDVFLGTDQFPILSLGGWLLDDLDARPGPERGRVERHLFLAATLLAIGEHTVASMLERDSFYGAGSVALATFATNEAQSHLRRAIPPESAFWDRYEGLSLAAHERHAEAAERTGEAWTPSGAEAPAPPPGRWAAPSSIVAGAALAISGREHLGGEVTGLLDDMAGAFQILEDVSTLHRDLLRRRWSYPIAVVAREAGISPRPWPEPTVLLGAMAATGSLAPILTTAVGRLHAAGGAAASLGLPVVGSYVAAATNALEEQLGALEPGVHAAASRPLVTIDEPTIRRALTMAEGFLLADPSLREAWETHREGMFGADLVASRYPAGLVLEILAANGLDVAGAVDAFLDFTAANGFRYFDHPRSDPDTDTVGVYLRLLRRGSRCGEHAAASEEILACLATRVEATGAVPVWIAGCDDDGTEEAPAVDLGEGCGTVAAHLLLGLIDGFPDRHAATIERGADRLLGRIESVGLAANVNYPPLYTLAVFLRLVGGLESGVCGNRLARRAHRTRARLAAALAEARRVPARTPQEAALLTIASVEGGSDDLPPGWRATILERQQFDGRWAGEPFAAAPNRGRSVTWYASATLTTALCYDALRRSNSA